MFWNPLISDPTESVMVTTAHEFEKILRRGVAGDPIVVGDRTVVPLMITTFGIGAGGGSMVGEPVGGGGGGGVIPCALLIFGPDGVQVESLPHQMTSAASGALAQMIASVSDRYRQRPTAPAPAAANAAE